MGVPYQGKDMTSHPQYITVRNPRGQEMLDALGARLVKTTPVSKGNRGPIVMQVSEWFCFDLLQCCDAQWSALAM